MADMAVQSDASNVIEAAGPYDRAKALSAFKLGDVTFYWITRLWFLAKRAELHDDPVVFAVTDKVSLAVGACVGAALLMPVDLC